MAVIVLPGAGFSGYLGGCRDVIWGLGRRGKSKVIVTGCNRPVKCKAVVKAKGAAANCQDFPILLRAGGA
jgi:hypothetical protein